MGAGAAALAGVTAGFGFGLAVAAGADFFATVCACEEDEYVSTTADIKTDTPNICIRLASGAESLYGSLRSNRVHTLRFNPAWGPLLNATDLSQPFA